MNLGIIVDHPKRDLPSLVRLSEEILRQDSAIKISLIPMYYLGLVLKNKYFCFDLLIFNFFRSANLKYILAAKKKNIKTIVYDQEGAGGIKGTNITSIIEKNRKYLKYIDLYFFWGTEQLNHFRKKIRNYSLKKTFITGWLSSDIIFEKSKKKFVNKKYILINTNFPSCDPRFNTLDKEIEGRLKTTSASKKEILKNIDIIKKRKENFITNISKILRKFPNENFILRIHPFEKKEKYLFLKKKYENLIISDKDNINDALINSKIFIHVDCTTAVNSNMLNIKPMSMSWLIKDKNETHNYISKKISFNFTNLNSFIKVMKKSLIEKKIEKKLKNKNIKFIEKYYGPYDGKRCYETAKKILKQLHDIKKKNLFQFNTDINYLHNIKENIKYLFFKILGLKAYLVLKKIFDQEYFNIKNKSKRFDLSDVKIFLRNKKIKSKNISLGIIELKY